MHPNITQLARQALETPYNLSASACLRHLNDNVACLQALGLTYEQAQRHPIAIVWADRAGLLMRCAVVNEQDALDAYATCRQLARLTYS